jgi:hypothetical protein
VPKSKYKTTSPILEDGGSIPVMGDVANNTVKYINTDLQICIFTIYGLMMTM